MLYNFVLMNAKIIQTSLFIRLVALFFLTCISACQSDTPTNDGQIAAPEIEKGDKEHLSIRVKRLDQDIFKVNELADDAFLQLMNQTYSGFFNIYARRIIKVGEPSQALFVEQVKGFANDPDINSIRQESDKLYSDFSKIESEIEEALNAYHYFFPDSLIPDIITMLSGFNYNVVTTDSAVGISLDMYLGRQSRFYEWLNFPVYKVHNMHSEMIVADVLRAMALSNFQEPASKDDLISHMVYHGKVIYFIRACIANIPEHLALGFTDEQTRWCYDNESSIWKHFVDNDLFYKVDHKNIVKYINEGPFTTGFPKESPGRVGVWLGYQIVKGFMKQKKISLQELMYLNDAKTIFAASKYKPTKSQ